MSGGETLIDKDNQILYCCCDKANCCDKKKKKEHLNYYTIKSRGISVAKCK